MSGSAGFFYCPQKTPLNEMIIAESVPSLVDFGSIGAVIFVVIVFLRHIREQNADNRTVLTKVTEAFNRNTEALARTERVLDATETALKKVLDRSGEHNTRGIE